MEMSNIQKNNDYVDLLHQSLKYFKTSKCKKLIGHIVTFHKYYNINSINTKGNTILHTACGRKNIVSKIFRTLIFCSIDMNIQNNDGNTALHIAIENNNFTAIDILLKQEKIDLSIQNNQGNTPLNLLINYNNFSARVMRYIKNNQSLKDNCNVLFSKLMTDKKLIDDIIKSDEEMHANDNNKYLINILQKYEINNQECDICFCEINVISCNYKHSTCLKCIIEKQMKKCAFCEGIFL